MKILSWLDILVVMKKRPDDIKDVTIDELAMMVQSGFQRIETRIDGMEEHMVTVATKEDVHNVETHLTERIDRVENLLLTDHRNRIERLEDKVLRLETSSKK